jgi:DNA-binding CsgD family transcriptional regulator
LAALVDKSLVRHEAQPGGEPRFGMLETIREYALARLEASGEAQALRRRHAAYFLALAEEAAPELQGPRQVAWFDRLAREHDNVRAALQWLTERAERGDAEAAQQGLRLAGAAAALRAALGKPLLAGEALAGDWPGLERTVAAVRQGLTEDGAAAAWAEGRALSLDEAMTYALAAAAPLPAAAPPAATTASPRPVIAAAAAAAPTSTGRQKPPPPAGAPGRLPDGLTAREAEVLGLLASGKSNQEIAAALVLSVRTVERHIANVYAKVGAHGRAEATAYALRHALA